MGASGVWVLCGFGNAGSDPPSQTRELRFRDRGFCAGRRGQPGGGGPAAAPSAALNIGGRITTAVSFVVEGSVD